MPDLERIQQLNFLKKNLKSIKEQVRNNCPVITYNLNWSCLDPLVRPFAESLFDSFVKLIERGLGHLHLEALDNLIDAVDNDIEEELENDDEL